MKLFYKLTILILTFLISISFADNKTLRGLDSYQTAVIDASKNARGHSNMGNLYYDEKNYIGAIKEYEIALNLTEIPRQKAVYMYNIANCLYNLGDYKNSKIYSEKAILNDYMNISYYKLLAKNIVKLKLETLEIEKLNQDKNNPFNEILVGLIYLEKEEKTIALTILDDFVNKYPKMLVTQDVIQIIKQIKQTI